MTSRAASVFLFFSVLFFCCKTKDVTAPAKDRSFDIAHSDPAAVELADSVLLASGGKERWDEVRLLTWTSSRGDFAWDKQKNRLRYKAASSRKLYLIDLASEQGRVSEGNQEITNAVEAQENIAHALAEWQAESTEFALPFLLKTSGGSLEYLGEDTLDNGTKCNLLQFNLVLNNSAIRYVAFVDLQDNLIKKLSFFSSSDQEQAAYTQIWDNYKPYGKLLLSADRSDGSGPRQLVLKETVDEKVFTEF